MSATLGAEDGIGSILKEDFRYWKSYEDIVEGIKSKAYTRTRIQRTLIHMLLNIKRDDVNKGSNYCRLLAMSENGAAYLREIKKLHSDEERQIPIITNINKEMANYPHIGRIFAFDLAASDLYNLVTGRDMYLNSEFVKFPLKI